MIQVIVVSLPFLVEYASGSVLQAPIHIGITVISIGAVVAMSFIFEELEALITLLTGIALVVINLSMWITYYLTTEQT